MFGLIPATLLSGYAPYAAFDAFGGTSIGSAIAAYYAAGKDPLKLPSLMLDAFPDIFTAPWYRYCWCRSSKYPSDGLVKFLNQIFGDMTLGKIQKPLYIVSFDFSQHRIKVFSSVGNQDENVRIADAVLKSVSAPTYFPPDVPHVDGGLCANNPSVVTAAGVAKNYSLEMDELSVMSIGTGFYTNTTVDMSGAASWGSAEWGLRIIPAMLDASVSTFEFLASQLPFKAYCRWNKVPLENDWTMDQTDILQALISTVGLYQEDFDKAFDAFIKESQK